jgi:hypothetical protein
MLQMIVKRRLRAHSHLSSWLAGALLVFAAGAACGESGVGEIREKCMPKGADEFCMKITALGDKKARIEATWTYAEDRSFDGVSIHEIFWSALMNCKTNSGDLQDVVLRDDLGSEVFIAQERLARIQTGIQNEQIDVIAAEACKNY